MDSNERLTPIGRMLAQLPVDIVMGEDAGHGHFVSREEETCVCVFCV